MDPAAYSEYLERLVVALAGDERVDGVVGAGASAGDDPGPWSDHEFWVVADEEAHDTLRADPSWLPGHGRLVLWMRQSTERMAGVYEDGHRVAAGMVDLDGLASLSAPGARVLLDKGGVAEAFRSRPAVAEEEPQPGTGGPAARFVDALIAGLRKHAAGERIQGRRLVTGEAVDALLDLAARAAGEPGSPGRGAAWAAPDLEALIDEASAAPVPEAALGLLAAAETTVKARVEEWPDGAAAVARRIAAGLVSGGRRGGAGS